MFHFLVVLLSCTGVSLGQDIYKAIAVVTPLTDASISGTIQFEHNNYNLIVSVNVSGITVKPDGDHGIHIHASGDFRGLIDGSLGNSVGSHFDPDNTGAHSCFDSSIRSSYHAGDMGNWQAVGGSIVQTKTIPLSQINLFAGDSHSIVGRAVVLHAATDDCNVTGSAAGRLAAGLIGIQNVALNKAGGSATPTKAVCVVQGTSLCTGTCLGGRTGLISLSDDNRGVNIRAEVIGLTTKRGIHVHAYGDLSVSSGSSAGGHYNPKSSLHGLPPLDNRHVGDLGNIEVVSGGNSYYNFTPTFTSFTWNVSEILGRAVVVHELLDRGLPSSCSNSSTYASGSAGNRFYWCVIGVAFSNSSLPNVTLPQVQFPSSWSESPCVTPTPTPTPTSSSSSLLAGISSFIIVLTLSQINE